MSLVELLPPATLHPQLSEKKSDFVHSNRQVVPIFISLLICCLYPPPPTLYVISLGVVFLSVSDSCDVGVEVETSSTSVTSDLQLAQQLHREMYESQLLRDSQLAEQLQMKENSYLTPR